ncbi:armadillo-type protein [Dunaliella salina]|uniref:Armadillo-type protein n=1 Tax=Dunaliella salina TaxID=3046 RepID=A0ABQ7H0T2_DUNSA|nr:armadillo-type protein [Dunaliella salina]|eukprot:KAF5840451.1 armadillo-type protein [Dunaliella salina]
MAAKPTGKPAQQKGGGGLKHHQPAGKKRPASGGSAGGGQEFKQNKKQKSSDVPAKGPKPTAAAPTEKPALSKHEKKEKIRQKKSALKKNFGIIQDAVPIWEVLRRHQTPNDEKARLVDQVLRKVDGKLLELARHHTASRILQFCVMYGTDAQKRLLMDQVKADFLALSKSKHGRHLVQKLISQAKKEEVPSLVGLCKGYVKELLRHPQGADVMIDLYDVANTQGRNAMCAEFYGREFSLFDGIGAKGSSLSSLSQLLEGSDNAKRRSVLLHMTKALMPIVEKGILHPPMVHSYWNVFSDAQYCM